MSKYINSIKEGIKNGFLSNHYGKILPIGILLESCGNEQLYFYLTMKLSNFLNARGDVEYSIFNVSDDKPILWPQTAIFNTNALNTYNGNIVATSLNTANLALNLSNDKYLYVYNVLELNALTQDDVKLLTERFKIFTRNENYAKFLSERYTIRCCNTYVPDGNPDIIAKIIENKGNC